MTGINGCANAKTNAERAKHAPAKQANAAVVIALGFFSKLLKKANVCKIDNLELSKMKKVNDDWDSQREHCPKENRIREFH